MRSSPRGDVNGFIYDAEGAHEGRYGYMRGLKWVHVKANMGSREQAVMGFESRAVSAQLTKHFVTIFSTTCNNNTLTEIF